MESYPAIYLTNVVQRFGALLAVNDVNLSVAAGERRAILGPNGAGKTTLFNLICGDYKVTSGEVFYFGENITHLKAHQRTRRGISRTYQNSLLFNEMTVIENLYIAVRGVRPNRFSFRLPRSTDEELMCAKECAFEVRLGKSLERKVETLSHGERRLLELGMALASRPKVLMLDEPAAGLSPAERPQLMQLLRDLPRDITLVLIEHDMDIALSIADKVTIMKDGSVVAEETPDKISTNPAVQEIYLGGAH